MAEEQRFKRLYPRRKLLTPCRVSCADLLIMGKIVDVSYNGVSLLLPGTIDLSEVASVEIPKRVRLRVRPVYNQTLFGISTEDRKSTRLNSSHGYISYAVFCL